jgi:hypothetical protein
MERKIGLIYELVSTKVLNKEFEELTSKKVNFQNETIKKTSLNKKYFKKLDSELKKRNWDENLKKIDCNTFEHENLS